ncbi:hypothetical protein KEJ36_04475 [Candidatus Bathyarchaeota archaeon]|nr:hypothetical protein [Candidatus Bathyarchaeota archaeon]MBS7628047.1 hypothetical protein [Candidatus Bathyarchaeota archaeon]
MPFYRGAQGIGSSIVETLTGHGADVAIFDLEIEKARKLADSIQKATGTRILAPFWERFEAKRCGLCCSKDPYGIREDSCSHQQCWYLERELLRRNEGRLG